MKSYNYIISSVLIISMLSSCVRESLEEMVKVNPGDDIVFGALAGFETDNQGTKTTYTGDTYELEDEDGGVRVFEYVHWLPGDKVLIHCDQGNQDAHYKVVIPENKQSSETGSLAKIQLEGGANNGIQWQDITKNDHTFYAVYPSPYQFSTPNVDSEILAASDYQDRIKVQDGILTCYLPDIQTPESIETVEKDGVIRHIAHPNMDYAYMIAKQVVTKNDDGVVPSSVALNFRPVVTALEITMTFPEKIQGTLGYQPYKLSSVQVSSSTGPIAGSFSMNLTDYIHNQDSDGYPSVEFDESSTQFSSVSMLIRDANGSPILIDEGESFTFTVFLSPTQLKNISIKVGDSNANYKNAPIDGLIVEAHKKQYVTNIVIPAAVQGSSQGSNWGSQLDPAAYVTGLSIPGTANSFSYNYGRNAASLGSDASSTNDNYMTQTLSFESQWNLGVRCFEIVSDRPRNSTTSLGSQNVKCNKTSVGLTVTDAFDKIMQKVTASPGEFAMIIMTYQPEDSSPARDPVSYMGSLKTFYNNYTYGTKSLAEYTTLYTSDLTVGILRDKPIMIVARPSQEGEDSENDVKNAIAGSDYNILTVMGWGSLPDKWYKRGYDALLYKGLGGSWGSTPVKDNISDHSDLPAIEEWIFGTGDRLTSARRTDDIPYTGNCRFNYLSDQNYPVWAQEWRRVHNPSADYADKYVTNGNNDQWFESFEEKKLTILDCVQRSMARADNTVYFNSLDGFYITTNQNSYDHYWYGNMGNIAKYADDINEWFYPQLVNYIKSDVPGPLGVVIMDRVSKSGAGAQLPQVIIDNNIVYTPPKDPNYSGQ